jgi:hypothetical protein
MLAMDDELGISSNSVVAAKTLEPCMASAMAKQI